jgi:hypothetical protein
MELIVLFVVIGLYMLPYIVAKSRGHANDSAIFVVNLFLGWTFCRLGGRSRLGLHTSGQGRMTRAERRLK